MDLTPENKAHIDSLSHYQLLSKIRFSPSGSQWFQGETGTYWMKRYAEKRDENPDQAVRDSKDIGWSDLMQDPNFEEYLGDGLYATFDGYQIWLCANDRYSGRPTDRVALDSDTIDSFIRYLEQLKRKLAELPKEKGVNQE